MSNCKELHDWGIYRKTLGLIESGTCGSLTSLRWTWLSPEGNADLLYTGVLAALLELSENLAAGGIERLHIEPSKGGHACFALASFQGEIVAEMEIHESLPSRASPIRFLVADFTGGRVTNRPLVGHRHDEGALLITEKEERNLFFEPLPEVSRPVDHEEIQRFIAQALEGKNK